MRGNQTALEHLLAQRPLRPLGRPSAPCPPHLLLAPLHRLLQHARTQLEHVVLRRQQLHLLQLLDHFVLQL
jgi:hypothetical protein